MVDVGLAEVCASGDEDSAGTEERCGDQPATRDPQLAAVEEHRDRAGAREHEQRVHLGAGRGDGESYVERPAAGEDDPGGGRNRRPEDDDLDETGGTRCQCTVEEVPHPGHQHRSGEEPEQAAGEGQPPVDGYAHRDEQDDRESSRQHPEGDPEEGAQLAAVDAFEGRLDGQSDAECRERVVPAPPEHHGDGHGQQGRSGEAQPARVRIRSRCDLRQPLLRLAEGDVTPGEVLGQLGCRDEPVVPGLPPTHRFHRSARLGAVLGDIGDRDGGVADHHRRRGCAVGVQHVPQAGLDLVGLRSAGDHQAAQAEDQPHDAPPVLRARFGRGRGFRPLAQLPNSAAVSVVSAIRSKLTADLPRATL